MNSGSPQVGGAWASVLIQPINLIFDSVEGGPSKLLCIGVEDLDLANIYF
jgi:hypothetical protein